MVCRQVGGCEDQNGGGTPDLDTEWDADLDGTPDSSFYVQNPTRLEEQLNATFSLIAASAASGTSSSVLATTNKGEGTLLQAFFRPLVNTGSAELTWVGFLQSLWMDTHGNIREETNGDKQLTLDEDRVLVYALENGETKAHAFAVSTGNEYPDLETGLPIQKPGHQLV